MRVCLVCSWATEAELVRYTYQVQACSVEATVREFGLYYLIYFMSHLLHYNNLGVSIAYSNLLAYRLPTIINIYYNTTI